MIIGLLEAFTLMNEEKVFLNYETQHRKTMKELIQLAESIGELAKLPDTTKELIQAQHNVINTQSARIQNLENRLVGIMSKDDVKSITVSVMEQFLKDMKPQSDQDEYTFLIDHANPDKSLEEAIRKGQELQQPFWEEGEEIFTAEFGIPRQEKDGMDQLICQ